MTYYSTKTYTHNNGLSCAFRQWRAESHCRFLHGYALEIRAVFAADTLDVRNWVVDFGSLKSFKQMLEDTLDHKTLVAADDPMFKNFVELDRLGIIDMVEVDATGCEAFARLVFEVVQVWIKDNGYGPRVQVDEVEVREHASNSAIYRLTPKA